jgi:hypothetical protein
MSGKTDPGSPWRQVSVVVRSDILLKATEMGLNISDELNRRLAEIGGIDYPEQTPSGCLSLSDTAATARTRDDGTKQRLRSPVLHPVINADDPAAATKVRKSKRQMPAEPVLPVPVQSDMVLTVPVPRVSTPKSDISPIPPVPRVSQRGKGKKGASGKKGKDEDLKKFVSTMIIRTDADDSVVPKEEMYLAFTRWCRDYRVATVPDRKVFATLLKNKFAITEKTVDGVSCWINIRLR